MNDFSPDDSATLINNEPCIIFNFGLIVTGKSEREHLTKLFASFWATGICVFKIICRIEQRSPITSPIERQRLKVTGTGGYLLPKDAEEIGIPARNYLRNSNCNFVILIDDLEHDRHEQANEVFRRYRDAFDAHSLLTKEQQRRASVHFLVNMLEAYYFAHAEAINSALGLSLSDYDGDVETIKSPKAKLRSHYDGFKEREDGGKILDLLDIEHVLSNPESCAWLRTLFAWCIKAIKQNPDYVELFPSEKYCLDEGKLSSVTKGQLDNL